MARSSDSPERLIERIKRTSNPLKRMRLALKFFAKPENYSREPIGWGEDYASIDDGREVAKSALQKSTRTKKGC